MSVLGNTNEELYTFVMAGDVEGACLMIENGGDVNWKYEEDKYASPLKMAVEDGHVYMVKLLIENGADVDVLDSDNRTPLHSAAQEGQVKVTNVLIQNGASVDKQDTSNDTPLHRAVLKGQVETTSVLLQNGANVNLPGFEDRTPLHYAAKWGQVDVAKVLLRNGADVLQQDKNYVTPLYDAAKFGKVEVAKLLAEWGATPIVRIGSSNFIKSSPFGNFYGNGLLPHLKPFTSLTRAIKSGHQGTVQGVLRQSIVQRDVHEMKSSYKNLEKATRDMAESEWKLTLSHLLHDHKVEMLYIAFETNDTGKRDAIFNCITNKRWIQTATFSNGSTLMHRVVDSQNATALERMLRYGVDPYRSSDKIQLVPALCQSIVRMSVDEAIAS